MWRADVLFLIFGERRLLARDDTGRKTPTHDRPRWDGKIEWTEMNLKFVQGLAGNPVKIIIFASFVRLLPRDDGGRGAGKMPVAVLEVIEPQ